MSAIAITGGAGFIGSNLVHKLLADGHRILNLDALTYAGNLDSLGACMDHPAHKFLQLDICESALIERALHEFQPDRLIHLAAESHVDRSITGPINFVKTNVMGTTSLLQATLGYWETAGKPADFRFIHVSTDEVFGALGQHGSFHEGSAYQPLSPYSASKAASDHLARAWENTYGLPVIICNCSNNYGPFQFPEKLIPVVITNALRGLPIPVYGEGSQVRDWIHVSDHCDALAIISRAGKPGNTYVIGADEEWRNIDLVKFLCRLIDELVGGSSEQLIRFVDDRLGHDFRYAINAGKLRNELGWQPNIAFESGLRSTVEWYFKNQSWWGAILDGSYRQRKTIL